MKSLNIFIRDICDGFRVSQKETAARKVAGTACLPWPLLRPKSKLKKKIHVWTAWLFLILATQFASPYSQAQIAFRGASSETTLTTTGLTPGFVNQTNNSTNNSTSIFMNRPNNVLDGHVLIAQITIKGIKATVSSPAGWTLLDVTSTSAAISGDEITQAIFWKVAESEPANYVWTWTGSARAAGGIMAFANVDSVNPIDVWGVLPNDNTATFTLPTLTVASPNTMLIAALGSSQAISNHNTPAGMDERYQSNTGGNTQGVRVSGSIEVVAAGSTGNRSAAVNATVDNISHLIALRPMGTFRIAVPPGTLSGDVMIASVLYRPCSNASGANCTTTIAAPAAWTLVNTIDTRTGGGTNGFGSRLLTYRRVANAEPSHYTWNFGGTPVLIDVAGGILSFSGVDTANPIVANAGQTTPVVGDDNRIHRTPSISTGTVANTMLVTSHSVNASGSFTGEAGLTEQVDIASRALTNNIGISLGIYTEAFAAPGVTGTRLATLSNPPNGNTGGAHILALRPSVSGPHHFEIQHGTGTGLTCTPSTLTIKACADASCASEYVGGVSGTMAAVGTPTVNWSGGNGFSIPFNSSQVTKDVQVSTPGTVVFGIASSVPAASNAPTCNFGTPSCNFTSADAGFLVSAPNHVSETASVLTIQAVRKSNNSLACTPGITGSKTVNLKCSYVNPGTGTLPVRVANTALAANAASACSPGGQNMNLTFNSSGIATPTLYYADVGRMQVDASFTGTPASIDAGLILTGGGEFISAPASFSVTNVTAAPIKAGADFSATVTAQNSLGATTPNFGRELAAEGATLSSNLVLPALPIVGSNPALANNVIPGASFAGGVATISNLSWGEAGTITVTANLTSGNYLGSNVAAAVGVSAQRRFIPNHFDTELSGGMPCPVGFTCPITFNGFVYSGQAFGTRITARNLAGGTTLNYDSGRLLSRAITLTAWNARGGLTQNPGGGVLSPNTVPAGAFTLGEANSSIPVYTLPNSYLNPPPTSPTDMYMRATETAADGVTSSRGASSVEGGLKIVSGRIFISNAHGSELLRLPLNITIQYWNGTRYVTSSTDSATPIVSSSVVFSDCAGNLSTGAGPSNCKPVVQVTPAASNIAIASGLGSFALTAPGAGNSGSANVRINAPAYLPSTPARATFGINKSRFIYLREMYGN